LLETPGAKKRDAGTPDGWSRLDFGHQVEFTLGVAEGVYVTVAIEKPSKVSVTEAVERALGQLQKKQAVA
jgi:hypothetical protein